MQTNQDLNEHLAQHYMDRKRLDELRREAYARIYKTMKKTKFILENSRQENLRNKMKLENSLKAIDLWTNSLKNNT